MRFLSTNHPNRMFNATICLVQLMVKSSMIQLSDYLSAIPSAIISLEPWIIPTQLPSIISNLIRQRP
jgi:hypothetical protein